MGRKPVAAELPPEVVAAGLAVAGRGGRCHVSAAGPAATVYMVFFVNTV